MRPSVRSTTLAAALVFGAAWRAGGQAAPPSPAPRPALLVLAKADRTLAIVDPATGAVAARVPVGPDPHEVVTSADGRLAYVSNYEGGAGHTLTVVDLAGRRVARVVDLGALRGPHGLGVAGDAPGGASRGASRGAVWFTAEGAKAVGRYDPVTAAVGQVVGTGQDRTHMLVLLPETPNAPDVPGAPNASNTSDATRVLTTNVRAGTVSLLEPRAPAPAAPRPRPGGPGAEWTATVIPVGPDAEGVDVAPGGREAWVANAGDGTVSVIDLAARRVVATLAAGVRGANRLKFTPDGALVFVSTLGGPDVTVLRASTRAVVARVPVGRGAAGILMQPDGARAYVACTPDDDVAVIDVRSLAVVARIRAGRGPDGLAWAAGP